MNNIDFVVSEAGFQLLKILLRLLANTIFFIIDCFCSNIKSQIVLAWWKSNKLFISCFIVKILYAQVKLDPNQCNNVNVGTYGRN